jgi:hypothetical protein
VRVEEPEVPEAWTTPPRVDSFLPPDPEPEPEAEPAPPPAPARDVPPQVPAGAALLTVPLLGLLRWRTRERKL